jgi:hypothetical protein
MPPTSAATALAQVLRASGDRSPLTGPLVLDALAAADPADPAHWWPQYNEPIFAEMYVEHLEQLTAGLLVSTLPAVGATS